MNSNSRLMASWGENPLSMGWARNCYKARPKAAEFFVNYRKLKRHCCLDRSNPFPPTDPG